MRLVAAALGVLLAVPAYALAAPDALEASAFRRKDRELRRDTPEARQAPEGSEAPEVPEAPEAPQAPSVVPYLRNLTRVESWRFFQPRPGGGDPAYTFVGNRATLGVRVSTRRLDLHGAFQYAQLVGLPQSASGPGALGTGALYFDAAQMTRAYQLYFKALSLRVKDIGRGVSVAAGRMGYTSGAESTSGVPSIEAVKRMRLDSRLIGEFEWSIFQRAYDGLRLDVDRPFWSATGAVLFPTQGGFEESASPSIDRLRVAAATVSLKPRRVPHSDVQVFAYHYRDRREVAARPDNVLLTPPPAVDVSIATLGASHVGVFPVARGTMDTLAWFAGQRGDWYGQPHRAFSVAVEGGYQWPARWEPWVRAGVLHASGDADAADNRHTTFFQMLPTVRRYAYSTAYAQMNLRDTFVQVLARPHTRVALRADLHRVSLAQAGDRWYSGGGATARTGAYFGYAARPSNGATRLGTVTEASVDVTLRRGWSVNGYAGVMKGGDVVRRLFAGDRLRFVYVENVVAF